MTTETISTSREALLDAALVLFAQRGYEGVSVAEIVDAAGFTKPTLYHHFGSKKGLLEALLRGRHALLMHEVNRALAQTADLTATLDRVLAAYLEFAQANGTFLRFWLGLSFVPPGHDAAAVVDALQRQQHAVIEELFFQAGKRHGNMRGRHVRYAVSFLGFIHTAMVASLSGLLEVTPKVRYELVHQFSHGIYS